MVCPLLARLLGAPLVQQRRQNNRCPSLSLDSDRLGKNATIPSLTDYDEDRIDIAS